MTNASEAGYRVGLVLGTVFSGLAVALGILLITNLPFGNSSLVLMIGLLSWVLLWFFTHDLAHLIIGLVTGVRFSYYYLGRSDIVRLKGFLPDSLKSMIIVLGLKIDRINSRANSAGFVAMYVAGPLASMFLPFIVPIVILLKDSHSLTGLILLIVSLVNLGFTLWFSPKVGCISKARRQLEKIRRR